MRQVRWYNRDVFSIFFNMKVYCVFSLESPQRGDSNEYTQYTISQYKKEIIPNLQVWNLFQGASERVRTSRGKKALIVRANEVLLYFIVCNSCW